MPRLDLTSLRYLASVMSIVIGIGLLIYVMLPSGKSNEAASAVEPTATDVAPNPTAEAPPAPPPPPAEPTPPPSAVALVKSTEADCPRGWRFVDNPQQRWTVCLPQNFLYFSGRDVLPFENVRAADLPAIYSDFSVVNESWYLAQVGSTTVDVLAPLSIRIEVVAPTTALDGCPIRQQTPTAAGAVSCTERLTFDSAGQPQFSTTGSYQRYRALTPTQPGKTTTEVFGLSLTAYSYSTNSALQQRLLALILETLKPY